MSYIEAKEKLLLFIHSLKKEISNHYLSDMILDTGKEYNSDFVFDGFKDYMIEYLKNIFDVFHYTPKKNNILQCCIFLLNLSKDLIANNIKYH